VRVPTISERIQALDEKEKQIKAKKELLINKEKQESRRIRNRQNIVAGAIMLEIAYSGPEEARRFIAAFEKRLTRDQDKKTMAPVLDDLRAIAAGKPVLNT
jgi:hypothetical protein